MLKEYFILSFSLILCILVPISSQSTKEWTNIEGAFKASRLGNTIIACQTKDESLLLTYTHNKQKSSSDSSNIHLSPIKISQSIGIAVGGLIADAQYISDKIFEEYAEYKFIYDSDIPLKRLANVIASMIHRKTLSLFQRPFGIRTVLIGYDSKMKNQVYEIDPLGSLHRCKLCVIGPLSTELNTKWKESMDPLQLSREEVIRRGVKLLREVLSEDQQEFFDLKNMCVAVVGENSFFSMLSADEIETIVVTDEDM